MLLGMGMVFQFQVNAAVLFSDDFEDGNFSGWTTSAGSWSVATDGSKVFKQSSTSANTYASTGSVGWTDYTVQTRIKVLSFNGSDRFVGLCVRYNDTSNFYYMRLSNSNKLEIRKKVNGSTTTLASKTYIVQTGTWYNLKFVVNGTALSCYINGTLELSAADTTFASGKVGFTMVNASAELDDVTVSNQSAISPTPSVTTTVTMPPSPSTSSNPGIYDLVVAKDGSGNYTTVQAAINAVANNNSKWFKIFIKNGRYQEVITVPSTKTYVRLIGESATGTILTYYNCSSTAGGTAASASVFLKANNFIAENLTFENSFDYDNSSLSNKQAVAAEPMADRQIFINCRFLGHQDTLYVRTGRQYFKNCYIEGHTDFIFGDATAVFDDCQIHSLYKSGACISAPSTLSVTPYGLVFLNCKVTGDSRLGSNSVYLGRPWHPSSSGQDIRSSATYLYCNLGVHIKKEGWTSMSGVSPGTERFSEYKNTGAGAVINSSRPQLSDAAAQNYTVMNILKGTDNWNPTILP